MRTRYASSPSTLSLNLAPALDLLTERETVQALLSRDACADLLTRVAAKTPSASATSALLALVARLATPACRWLEGGVVVELFGEDASTRVRVMSEIGASLRERVLPPLDVAVALEELVDIATANAEHATAFGIERISSRCVLLRFGAAAELRAGRVQFDISESSLAWRTSDDDVDSGWDDVPITRRNRAAAL